MARSSGRFNKILEFIGLVDDETEDEMDRGGRTINAQPYPGQARRPGPAPTARPTNNQYASDQRANPRYQSSARPDYEARMRQSDYSPRYPSSARPEPAPRSDYGAYRGGEYRAAPKEYDRGYRPEAYTPQPAKPASIDEFERAVAPTSAKKPNVVPMRTPSPSHQTVIYYLRSLEECRDVINDLLDNKTVLLNLEDMDERIVQRGIDTLCGAAFALGATLRKASEKTYLIAPNSVEVASTNDTERRF